MFSITEGLDLVIAAIDRAGYNGRIKLAIDAAATDFCVGKVKSVKSLSSMYAWPLTRWFICSFE